MERYIFRLLFWVSIILVVGICILFISEISQGYTVCKVEGYYMDEDWLIRVTGAQIDIYRCYDYPVCSSTTYQQTQNTLSPVGVFSYIGICNYSYLFILSHPEYSMQEAVVYLHDATQVEFLPVLAPKICANVYPVIAYSSFIIPTIEYASSFNEALNIHKMMPTNNDWFGITAVDTNEDAVMDSGASIQIDGGLDCMFNNTIGVTGFNDFTVTEGTTDMTDVYLQ